jgi:hypothetical protein
MNWSKEHSEALKLAMASNELCLSSSKPNYAEFASKFHASQTQKSLFKRFTDSIVNFFTWSKKAEEKPLFSNQDIKRVFDYAIHFKTKLGLGKTEQAIALAKSALIIEKTSATEQNYQKVIDHYTKGFFSPSSPLNSADKQKNINLLKNARRNFILYDYSKIGVQTIIAAYSLYKIYNLCQSTEDQKYVIDLVYKAAPVVKSIFLELVNGFASNIVANKIINSIPANNKTSLAMQIGLLYHMKSIFPQAGQRILNRLLLNQSVEFTAKALYSMLYNITPGFIATGLKKFNDNCKAYAGNIQYYAGLLDLGRILVRGVFPNACPTDNSVPQHVADYCERGDHNKLVGDAAINAAQENLPEAANSYWSWASAGYNKACEYVPGAGMVAGALSYFQYKTANDETQTITQSSKLKAR